jgi:DNA-binding NarL/FixJ family response regulator
MHPLARRDLWRYVRPTIATAGVLLNDASPETLIIAIRAAANGRGLVAPQVTSRLIARFAATAADLARRHELDKLSEREREVLLEVGLDLDHPSRVTSTVTPKSSAAGPE